MRARRRLPYVGGAAVVAVAVCLGVLAASGWSLPWRDAHTAGEGAPKPSIDYASQVVDVFDVGHSPAGPRLFECEQAFGLERAVAPQALRALTRRPDDPDYTTHWSAGSLLGVTDDHDGRMTVRVSPDAPVDDVLAVQQLAYTLHSVSAATTSVLITGAGPDRTVPLAPARGVLAPVSTVEPGQDEFVAHYGIDDLGARGLTTVTGGLTWKVVDRRGRTVLSGRARTRPGPGGVNTWTAAVDLTRVRFGVYTFEVSTTANAARRGGPAPTTDTRRITVPRHGRAVRMGS